MRIRLRNIDKWKAMPVDEFVKRLRPMVRTDPSLINTRNFAAVFTRKRQQEILKYYVEEMGDAGN